MAIVPVGDEPRRERRSFPIVVVGLIALNVLVFLYQLTLAPQALATFVSAWGATPAEITAGQDLPPPVPVPVYLTLLTSMFIHGGIAHLLLNMVFLGVFGDNVEDALGHLAFLLYYLAAGVIAGLVNAFILAGATVPGIGASGAVAGVLAGYLILFPRAEVRTLLLLGPFLTVGRVGALLMIGTWFVLQLWQGVASLGAPTQGGGVAYFAHVGGFLAGAAMMLAIVAIRGERVGNLGGGFWIGPVFRNWLLLIGALALAIGVSTLLASFGQPLLAGLIQVAVLFGVGIAALVDGWRRVSGQPSFLGPNTGFGRLLAMVQILLAVGLLIAMVALVGF